MTGEDLQQAFFLARKAAPYACEALATVRIVWSDKVTSNGVPTMACDAGWRVYVHPDCTWTAQEAAWVLLHEVLGHLVRQHHKQARLMAADPQLANIAMDAEIESWNWPTLHRPKGGITPSELGLPEGKLWGWYYDKLKQQQQGGGDNGGDKDGDKDKPQPFNGGSSAADGIKRDYELADDDQDTPALNDVLAEALTKATAEKIRKHAQRGNVPAGLRVWADSVLATPKVNWRNVLRQFISQHTRRGLVDKVGTAKVHRVSGLLTPRWTAPQPNVVIVADTSGSMDSEGGKVLSEVIGIARVAGRVDVAWTDVTPVWQKNVRNRHELKPVGGGSTDLRPAISEAVETKADAIVIVTDCETPWPSQPIRNVIVLAVRGNPPTGWRSVKM